MSKYAALFSLGFYPTAALMIIWAIAAEPHRAGREPSQQVVSAVPATITIAKENNDAHQE